MDIKEDIINRLSIFKNFYDEIRIVEPFKDKSEVVIGGKTARICDKCFTSSGKTAPCNNCISSKAYYHDDTIIKYDYKNSKPITMISSPVEIDGKKYIVELTKNIHNENLVSDCLKEENALKIISELNYQVIHDELTQLYNRRYIDDMLQKVISESCDSGKVLSIIMCDIDYFKCINDTYGHQNGDEILKCFASIINEISVKESGWTGRYGGEEFICILPDKNADEAYDIAEDMRQKFENSFIAFEGRKIKTTASFGISSISPCVEMTSKNLIKIADNRLYSAKENGRNLVVK